MPKVDVYFLVPSEQSFWPLTSQHPINKTIMGKQIIDCILESISSVLDIRRIIFLYENEKPFFSSLNHDLDTMFIKADLENLEGIWEHVESISNEETVLISHIFNLALLDEDFLRRIQSIKNRVYLARENLLAFFFGSLQYKNQAKKIFNSFEIASYSWDLYKLFSALLRKIKQPKISNDIKISDGAKIIGNCIIEDNVTIYENAVIKGPCFIGEGTVIGNNAIVRESIIEGDSIIGANMEVARSWLGKKTETHSGFIGDSIFDQMVHTGAGFIAANVRLDRKTISVKFKGRKIDTGLPKLGVIIGKNVEIGIHVGTMPGVLIGNNVLIGPGTLVFDNVEDNMRIYMIQRVMKKEH